TCASPTGLPWALVTERPVALPPEWLEESSMSKTDEYRQFANDCIVWARIATSDDQRVQFLELAKKWISDAESIDRGTELQPNEAVKASEMAGEEIDRLGDPLATGEERQLRKRRLIEGPQEFRDIRSNRAKIEPRFPRLPIVTPEQTELVRQSFDAIWPVRRKLADQFYRRFFELAPDAQGLFRGDMER